MNLPGVIAFRLRENYCNKKQRSFIPPGFPHCLFSIVGFGDAESTVSRDRKNGTFFSLASSDQYEDGRSLQVSYVVFTVTEAKPPCCTILRYPLVIVRICVIVQPKMFVSFSGTVFTARLTKEQCVSAIYPISYCGADPIWGEICWRSDALTSL